MLNLKLDWRLVLIDYAKCTVCNNFEDDLGDMTF